MRHFFSHPLRNPAARAAAVALLVACAESVANTPAAPESVLSLSASAQVEVARDWLTVTLATTREGPEASAVQSQLTQALEAALAPARRAARSGQIEVQTGVFSVQPRRGPKGEIATWWGRAELIVQGRDLAAIAQLAGRLTPLMVANVAYTLSREARQQAETEAAAQAIGRYRALAAEYARQFGYAAYAVREVTVGTGEMPPVRPMPLALRSMDAVTESSLPLEAGQGTVSVTVSGTVQMR